VAAVLEYAAENHVEPFLEPVLELCHTIVVRDAAEVEAGSSTGPLMGVLLEQSGVFLQLAGAPEPAISVAAGRCLLDMVSVPAVPNPTVGHITWLGHGFAFFFKLLATLYVCCVCAWGRE
jgi:hypothetical protein